VSATRNHSRNILDELAEARVSLFAQCVFRALSVIDIRHHHVPASYSACRVVAPSAEREIGTSGNTPSARRCRSSPSIRPVRFSIDCFHAVDYAGKVVRMDCFAGVPTLQFFRSLAEVLQELGVGGARPLQSHSKCTQAREMLSMRWRELAPRFHAPLLARVFVPSISVCKTHQRIMLPSGPRTGRP